MKFIIHQHSDCTAQADHYDFMLERSTVLDTWQINLSDLDLLLKGKPISTIQIAGHRKKYLTYEGPVSGNRGKVMRVDSGSYETVEESPTSRIVKLHGNRLRGVLHIQPAGKSSTFRLQQAI